MIKQLCLFFGCFLLFDTATALNCEVGHTVTALIVDGSDWEVQECPADFSCVKIEGSMVIFGAYTVNCTSGACVEKSKCEERCEDLATETLYADVAEETDVDQSLITYDLKQCKMACCSTDMCNSNSVAVIESQTNEVATTIPTIVENLTSAMSSANKPAAILELSGSSSDVFECEEAYEIFFEHVSSGVWNRSQCRRDLGQRCIRGEGTLEFSPSIQVNISSTYCANESDCLSSCTEFFQPLLNSIDPVLVGTGVVSCALACCDSDKCNNQSVATILQSTPPPPPPPRDQEITKPKPNVVTKIGTANPNSLHCLSGYELRSSIENNATWHLAKCEQSANQMCLRTEMVATIYEKLDITVFTGSCVDRSVCQQSCQDMARTLFFAPPSNAQDVSTIDANSANFDLTSCKRACCDSNNCNANSVEHILETTNPVDPVDPTPSEVPENEETLECHTGYQAKSSIFNEKSWTYKTCNSTLNQRCFRAEGRVQLYGYIEIDATVGACIADSKCNPSICRNLLDFITNGPETLLGDAANFGTQYSIDFCNVACCRENGCNNKTIEFEDTEKNNSPNNITTTTSITTAATTPSAITAPLQPQSTQFVPQINYQNSNTLFLLSLVQQLDRLPAEVASEVKLRMMEELHEASYGKVLTRDL